MGLADVATSLNKLTIPALASVVVLGSLLNVPSSYFSNSRNVFNVYFIKMGWMWLTLLYATHYSIPTSYGYRDQSRKSSVVIAIQYLIYSFFWFALTSSFDTMYFGSCSVSSFSSPRECHVSGNTWGGIDISGHAFLIVFSSLIMLKIAKDRIPSNNANDIVKYFTYFFIFVRCLWIIMLFFTFAHFHTFHDKILGVSFAALCFLLTEKLMDSKMFKNM